MHLIDRAPALDHLRSALAAVADGDGRVVLVAGEAGIGKTSLLRTFLADIEATATTVTGACDDLLTPVPLAPVRDIGRRLGGELAAALNGGAPRQQVHDALAAALVRLPPPVVVALEDLHWADDATLDAVTVLARWIEDRPILLVLTYRDDEVGPGHPLARVLARLPAPSTSVVTPTSLDADGVAELAAEAGSTLDVAELHRVTGGNPFYVTEVLASEGLAQPPPSVAFAVTARLARLPADTQELLQLVSLVPGRMPVDLLAAIEPSWAERLEPAEAVGMIEAHGTAVAFRHELARRAVAETLTALGARSHHAQILAALDRAEVDPATLVHHAEGAGDVEALVRHARAAAAAAAGAEAYREAMAHYERALAHPDHLDLATSFDMWFGLARARVASGRDGADVMDAAGRAVAIAEQLDDPERLARALASQARLASWADDHGLAASAGAEAVRIGRTVGPSRALAEALAAVSYVGLAQWEFEAAADAAREAREVATVADARETASLAEMFLAVTAIAANGDLGPLHAAEASATEQGHRWPVAEGMMAACTALYFRRAHADTIDAIDRTLRFLGVNDLAGGWGPYLHAIRARALMAVGRWAEAADELEQTLAGPRMWGWPRGAVLETRGRLRARSGDAGAEADLTEAWSIAADGGSFQLVFMAGTAIAEAAWLAGRTDAPPPELLAVADHPVVRDWPAARGEVAVWLRRTGADPGDVGPVTRPHRLLLAGDHHGAAVAWDGLGCVYQAAEARVLTDDPPEMLAALEVLDGLGAVPLARRARRRLRELGERPPRGPQEATRAHPLGLTARQAEVLDVLVTGATNAEIAASLVVSVRTVDNHVSAILRKLDVATREEAVAVAEAAGA